MNSLIFGKKYELDVFNDKKFNTQKKRRFRWM